MSRKTATKVSENIATKSANFTHGDLLKRALTWVINDSMFCHITLHGNIKWKARQLVIVAVLWVWRSCGCGLDAQRSDGRLFMLDVCRGLCLAAWRSRLIRVLRGH